MASGPPRKKRTLILIGLLLILVLALVAMFHLLTGWSAPASARRVPNPVPATDAAIHDGHLNYTKHCKSCHGINGDGNGERASKLSALPTDFTSARNMERASDGELFWKITHGRRPMPGFQQKLTDTERWQLVDYIRTLAKKPSPAK